MNEKITKFVKTTKGFMSKHSPEILTGIGITGMITSTVLAVKATPKALYLLEDAEGVKERRLTPVEVVKITWKEYLPSVVVGALSVSCIIGASRVNIKRNAALTAAYTLSERTLMRYKDKVIDTIGEKKEKEIREKIAQDEVDKKPVSSSQVILTSKGNTLCMDYISGRYFRSDLDMIRKAIINLNRQIVTQNYISLNEFYNMIGLEHIKNGDYLGWNLDDGEIELDLSATIVEDDEACVVIDYNVSPKYDFDKFR